MWNLLITGLPRSGTTITYELIARSNRGKALFLYEPFASPIFEYYKIRGYFPKFHDYLDVTHDYDKLPNDILNLIINNNWLIRYVKGKEPYLGKYCFEILNKLNNLNHNIVIKDLYLWVITEDILKHFKDLKIIFTYREVDGLCKAFLKWFRENPITFTQNVKTSLSKVKKYSIREIITKLHKVPNVLKYILLNHKQRINYMYGLSPYVKYFNLEKPNKINEETLVKVVKQVHEVYKDFIKKIENKYSDRVFILKLEELQENPSHVVNKLNNFLKPIFEIRNYNIVKKC